MIKLTDILNELEINKFHQINAEKVIDYWVRNIKPKSWNDVHNDGMWNKYLDLKEIYAIKYNRKQDNTTELVFNLSRPDLITFYNEMRKLVQKYRGQEILNELEINNPRITAEKVEQYYRNNIHNNNIEFELGSNGWKEYSQICEPYCEKYDLGDWVGRGNFKYLSQPDLIRFYNEMRQLVQKHVGKEI